MEYYSLKNSVWPNGIKKDDEGYNIFYPLGTNKVDITTITWPEGDTLISPFVYQNDILVGFVDTLALTVSGSGATTTMPYTHIEADFSSIRERDLKVNVPSDIIVKKFTWMVDGEGDTEGGSICDSLPTPDYELVEYSAIPSATKDLMRAAVTVDGNTMYDASGNQTGSFNFNSLASGDSLFGFTETFLFGIPLGVPNNWGQGGAGTAIVTFNTDMCNLVSGYCMFYGSPIESFTGALCSLENAMQMFRGTFLTSFDSPVPSLKDGSNMFMYCSNLESFNSELPKLEVARTMFQLCSTLKGPWTINLPSLKNALNMFNSCYELQSFNAALPSLTNGEGMFSGAYLEEFDSALPVLENGEEMFYGCRLNAQSVNKILSTIPTVDNGIIDLGIGGAPDESLTDEAANEWMNAQANQLAIECGYVDTTALLNAFTAKGWTVNFIFSDSAATTNVTIYPKDGSGSSGGITTTGYSLRNRRSSTLPIYVKLVEITEDGDGYTYTSQDGTKFYKLKYFHITNGSTKEYTLFNSVEEAIEHYNIKPAA